MERSLIIGVMETFFGVLKSKGTNGWSFVFWAGFVMEFSCAFGQSMALFLSEHGALRVRFRNRAVAVGTSSLAVAINGILLIVEAGYIGRKLKADSWYTINSRRSIIISVVLFALLLTPAIPILIAAFGTDVNDCIAVNRSVLDPLTILVTATPVICLVAGFVAWKFLGKLKVTKRVARCAAMFVAYVFYFSPVVALGILMIRTPSKCDKHTALLISNLIPAVVICCSGLVLDVGRNPDSEDPEVPDENRGDAHCNASVRLSEQCDTSGVSSGVNSN